MPRLRAGGVLVALVLARTALLGAETRPDLLGVWEAGESGYLLVLELRAGGKGAFDGTPISYSVAGDRLFVTEEDGYRIEFTFALDGGTLRLGGGDLDGTMAFARRGGAGAGGASPAAPAVVAPIAPAAQPAPGPAAAMAGTWEAQTPDGVLRLVLNPDLTGSLNGAAGGWLAGQGTLTLAGRDGAYMTYAAAVAPDVMTLSGGDLLAPLTLRRTAAAGAAPPPGEAAQPPAAAGGALAELVGTWCYMSTFRANSGGGSSTQDCYTLRPDGSYSRGGESSMSAYGGGMWGGTAGQSQGAGRWSATATTLTFDGETVYYERRNNQNNEPTICVDGRCYVTYHQRAPW